MEAPTATASGVVMVADGDGVISLLDARVREFSKKKKAGKPGCFCVCVRAFGGV